MAASWAQRWHACRKTGLGLYFLHGFCRLTGWPVKVTARFGAIRLALRAGTADVVVAREGLGGEFDDLAAFLPPDFCGTIIDAGGHIGSTALALAAMWPKAAIFCVEPSEDNLPLLKQNVAQNARIRVFPAALTAEAGTATLCDRGTGTWGSSVIGSDAIDAQTNSRGQEVACVTLETLTGLAGPGGVGLLKLDIEGAEREIFERCQAELSRIPVVMAELHDRILPGCRDAFERFAADRDVVASGPEKLVAVRRPAPATVA